MDFAIVGFCRVKEVKLFPVMASGESLNELIILTHKLILILTATTYIEKH